MSIPQRLRAALCAAPALQPWPRAPIPQTANKASLGKPPKRPMPPRARHSSAGEAKPANFSLGPRHQLLQSRALGYCALAAASGPLAPLPRAPKNAHMASLGNANVFLRPPARATPRKKGRKQSGEKNWGVLALRTYKAQSLKSTAWMPLQV